MRWLCIFVAVIASVQVVKAEDATPSRIASITKSARDMMPAMPAMPSLPLPSMPDLSMPDFSDASGRIMTEFNSAQGATGNSKLRHWRAFAQNGWPHR